MYIYILDSTISHFQTQTIPNIIGDLRVLLQPHHHQYLHQNNPMKVTPLNQTYKKKAVYVWTYPIVNCSILSLCSFMILHYYIACFKIQFPLYTIDSSYDPKTCFIILHSYHLPLTSKYLHNWKFIWHERMPNLANICIASQWYPHYISLPIASLGT